MAFLTFPQLEKVGRLGNQLFQIASTIGLARRYGMEPRFPTSWSYRPWFNVPDEFFADGLWGVHPTSLPDLAHMDERTRIYLQDLSFFADVEGDIEHWFRPSLQAQEHIGVLPPGALILHVRRGDNVNQQDCYPLPSQAYYLDAVRRHPELDVVIYGDDYAWNVAVLAPQVRQANPDAIVRCVPGIARPKEHEKDYWTAPVLDWIDLHSMAAEGTAFCLSNSTLGWWSAWLSGSEDVSYPAPWYGPELDVHLGQGGYIDGSLMMPPKWVERNAR